MVPKPKIERDMPVLMVCTAVGTFDGIVDAMVTRVVRTFWESLGMGWVRFRAVAGPGEHNLGITSKSVSR